MGFINRSGRIGTRAAAVQICIEAGDAASEGARASTGHKRPEVRLAPCQVLVGLGLEAWLEENLL